MSNYHNPQCCLCSKNWCKANHIPKENMSICIGHARELKIGGFEDKILIRCKKCKNEWTAKEGLNELFGGPCPNSCDGVLIR